MPEPRVVETHISRLFFVDDRVFKCCRAVDVGFLDHRDRAVREHACRREVVVNHRFAPDVYEGTAVLYGPDRRPCEHFVVMRRLPDDRRLTALLATAEGATCVREVARAVAALHARAPRSPEIDRAGTHEHLVALWTANLREMRPFVGTLLPGEDLSRVEEQARRYLDGRQPLLEARIAAGRIRDGHGDLLADDIFCLHDGPRILDALAFRDDLRHGDVLLDAAFLAMDLERLGHPALASRFLAWHREFSAETHPESLAHHYLAYRALVRCKIRAMRWSQTGDPVAAEDARSLLAMVLRHLDDARVRLVLVGGRPGTGKSTLAWDLAAQAGWLVLSSDELRKEAAGLAHEAPAPAPPGEGLYRPEARAGVYAQLVERARSLLDRGETVVLDASWSDARSRALAGAAAAATASDLVELVCVAPSEVAERRLAERDRRDAHGSDATVDSARFLASSADPWPTAIPIDTTCTIAESVLEARRVADDAVSAPAPDTTEGGRP